MSFGAFVERGLRAGKATENVYARRHLESIVAGNAVAHIHTLLHPYRRYGIHRGSQHHHYVKVVAGIGP